MFVIPSFLSSFLIFQTAVPLAFQDTPFLSSQPIQPLASIHSTGLNQNATQLNATTPSLQTHQTPSTFPYQSSWTADSVINFPSPPVTLPQEATPRSLTSLPSSKRYVKAEQLPLQIWQPRLNFIDTSSMPKDQSPLPLYDTLGVTAWHANVRNLDDKVDNTSTTEELTTTTCKSGFDLNMIDVTAIMQKNGSAYRVLHTKQNEAWIFDGVNSTLKLNDEKLVEKKTLCLIFHLRDMTLTSSQDIIATDHHNKHIKKILPSGSISTLCSTAPLIPGGICINRSQQLVVGLRRDWKTPPVKLVIYSSDGSAVLQEIEIDEDGNPLFRMEITQVKQNGDGDYVVADRHSIVCVSSEGRLRWKYDIGYWDLWNSM